MNAKPPLGWYWRDGQVYCYKFQSGGCYSANLKEPSTKTSPHDATLGGVTQKINAVAQGKAQPGKDLHLIDVGGGELLLVWATCKDETFVPTVEEREQRNTPNGLNKVRMALGLDPLT
jgi:hypothetical protein